MTWQAEGLATRAWDDLGYIEHPNEEQAEAELTAFEDSLGEVTGALEEYGIPVARSTGPA